MTWMIVAGVGTLDFFWFCARVTQLGLEHVRKVEGVGKLDEKYVDSELARADTLDAQAKSPAHMAFERERMQNLATKIRERALNLK